MSYPLAVQALIWSKMSTGLPLEVSTAQKGGQITYCKLDIDIYKNEPNVIVHERRPNPDRWHGAEVSVVIEGNWSTYRVCGLAMSHLLLSFSLSVCTFLLYL